MAQSEQRKAARRRAVNTARILREVAGDPWPSSKLREFEQWAQKRQHDEADGPSNYDDAEAQLEAEREGI